MEGQGAPESLTRWGRPLRVREGRAFHYQDDPSAEAVLLLKGSVRPVKFASDGKPFDLPPLGPGAWLGLAESFQGSACHFDAVAVEECQALAFSGKALEKALAEREPAAYIAQSLAREIAWLHRILADEDSQGKLLSYLLSRRRSLGGLESGTIVLTQAALAQALGLTRETVNRQLKELEGRGLLSIGRGEIGVPDWAALETFSRERSE